MKSIHRPQSGFWLMTIVVLVALIGGSAFAIENYIVLDTRLKSYQERIGEMKKHIQDLAEKKAATKDPAQIRGILDEMVAEAKNLKETFVKFQRDKKHWKFDYPSQGDDIERKYHRFEIQTVEELNAISNIDLRLRGVFGKVQKTYEKPPEVLAKEKKARDERNRQSGELKSKETQEDSKKEAKKPMTDRPKLSY